MWSALLDEKGIQRPQSEKAIKPSAREMKQAEKDLNLGFPASYRTFCLELGPGTFDDLVAIAAPVAGKLGSLKRQVDIGRKSLAFVQDQIPSGFTKENMISFASTMDGVNFYWKIDEPHEDEYPIYAIDSQAVPPEVVQVAASFPEFIEQVCLGDGLIEAGVYSRLREPREPVFHQIT